MVPTESWALLESIKLRYGCRTGETCYDLDADLNGDGLIGIYDWVIAGRSINPQGLGDYTAVSIGSRSYEPGTCITLHYDSNFLNPDADLYQGCVSVDTKEHLIVGDAVWVGPGRKSTETCP